jgi:hypothetical protein
MRVCYEMQPSNTKHLGIGEASPGAADDAGGGILMTKDFRAARERQQLEPTAAPPTTEHDWPEAWEQTRPALRPYTSGTLTYTRLTKAREAALRTAVIRLVVHRTTGTACETVDPGHNPDGDTANHAESWQYTQ